MHRDNMDKENVRILSRNQETTREIEDDPEFMFE